MSQSATSKEVIRNFHVPLPEHLYQHYRTAKMFGSSCIIRVEAVTPRR